MIGFGKDSLGGAANIDEDKVRVQKSRVVVVSHLSKDYPL
jgi:hypothetical protein